MYVSTRGNERVCGSEAIIKGLAEDGGLFIKDEIKRLDFNTSFLSYSYQELTKVILLHFFDDFSEDEINEIISKSYNKVHFREKMVDIIDFDYVHFLELFHGPTLAFKDMALTMLPNLLSVAKKKKNIDKKTLILTATSGDTGSAALSGFSKVSDNKIIVLYPDNGVSEIQERQMMSFVNQNADAFAISGNFDDCQNFVKEIFQTFESEDFLLSSANSINIGRLVPQIVYYFYAYLDLVKKGIIEFGDKVNVSIPTGNFGNILASYLAFQIGLPINDFICASNSNSVLTEFFNTGIYDKNREFIKTNSPSMDILISSNLERLIYLVSRDSNYVKKLMNELKTKGKYTLDNKYFKKLSMFKGYKTDEYQTERMINNVFEKHNYLIDPHTAVAYDAYMQYKKKNENKYHTIIASTASPFKFPKTICKALNIDSDISYNEFELINEIILLTNVKANSRINDLINLKLNKKIKTKEEVLKEIYGK